MKWYCAVPLVFLCGCAAVGPDYKQPQLAVSPQFVGSEAHSVTGLAASPWWQRYGDHRLNDMIERGLRQNLTMQAALERINEARASLRATGVNAMVSGSLEGSSTWKDGSDISSSHSNTGTLGAAFAIDLFGGIRREQERAQADLIYAEADVEVSRLAWLAEFIADYANAQYYRIALNLTQESVDKRRETVAITKRQLEAGAATEYGLAEAEALLATAEADLPKYTALFKSYIFAMATLLNEEAAPLLGTLLQAEKDITVPEAAVAIGIPADLLRNRPDIRRSEASLRYAVADVGMAEADLYPSLSLSGTFSMTEGARTWGFGPSLNLPLFNRGALSAERDAKISAARQAEISYRAAVLTAVKDVQVAQSNLQQYQLRARSLEKASDAYQRALVMARNNYLSGAITLLDLLDTDRSAASAAISAASAKNDALQEWASLQLAVGAGAAVGKE